MENELLEQLQQEEEAYQRKIAHDTLERYSGSLVAEFQPYVLLTNFPRYIDAFVEKHECTVHQGAMFTVAHAKDIPISIIDFKIGSPAAALVVDLCAFLPIEATLLLGMCGGLRSDYKVGDYFVPVASIRGDGTSDFYFPAEVPALANFTIQKMVTQVLETEEKTHHIGITHTTNKRFWEFNKIFRDRLNETRPQSVEMECATLFVASYSHGLPLGALLLISDLPIKTEGIKTKESSETVFKKYSQEHVELGVKILLQLKDRGTIRKQKKKQVDET